MPSSYIIEDEENPGTLILDCAYEFEPTENGIVLQWLLNGTLIYQWLPQESSAPHTFVSNDYVDYRRNVCFLHAFFKS